MKRDIIIILLIFLVGTVSTFVLSFYSKENIISNPEDILNTAQALATNQFEYPQYVRQIDPQPDQSISIDEFKDIRIRLDSSEMIDDNTVSWLDLQPDIRLIIDARVYTNPQLMMEDIDPYIFDVSLEPDLEIGLHLVKLEITKGLFASRSIPYDFSINLQWTINID